MIVLDTNVLSEIMRPVASATVLQWIARHPASELYTTVISRVEVFFGIELLPKGRRRTDLLAVAHDIFEKDFAARVLPFDNDAALVMPEIMAHRKSMGRPLQPMDAQIAAIARSRGAPLATRNIPDFADCGIGLINPWKAKS